MKPVRLFLALTCGVTLFGGDWGEWRGPKRDGAMAAEPAAWPAKLRKQWEITVGEGHSSPIFAGGSIYQMARLDGQETVFCIDPATGKERWRQKYAAPYSVNVAAVKHGAGPKSTPVYSNGRLYGLGISGILTSFDAETGKVRWRKDFVKDFKQTSPAFGNSMSPIVDNGMLIAHVGGDNNGAIMAFDANTGDVKWSWTGDGPAYASPLAVELGGVRQIVTQTQKHIVGLAASSGKLLWKIPFTTSYEQNSVTPLVYKDTLILSGLDKGTMAIRLAHTGDQWNPQTVWQTRDASMYMSSPVLAGDLLFGFSHLKKGQLFCLDAATGAAKWIGAPRQGENAALLIGRTSLVALLNDGEMVVAKPSGDSFQEIRRYTVAENQTWAHPLVMADGVVVKDTKSLVRWIAQ